VVLNAYKCRAFKLISVSVKYQVLKQIYQERYGYNKTGKKDEPTEKKTIEQQGKHNKNIQKNRIALYKPLNIHIY
jgi:hypothetical protein